MYSSVSCWWSIRFYIYARSSARALNSNSHTKLSYSTKIEWSNDTLHLELEGMNGEGVWASIYRWIEVDPWIHVLSISFLGSNLHQMECDDAPKLCFLAWVHAQGRWCTRGVDRPSGVGRPPLSHVGPSPPMGWVPGWCRVGMCWSFHHGMSVWWSVGHPIHVTRSFTIEKKHTLHPRVKNHLGVCYMDHGGLGRLVAHRGGWPTSLWWSHLFISLHFL